MLKVNNHIGYEIIEMPLLECSGNIIYARGKIT
jgi:hypothetical protein